MVGRIGRQAKVISPGGLRRLLSVVSKSRFPHRDRVMVLLAVRAGLRAREIAHLSYGMVVESNGRIGSMIEVRNDIAKRGSGRRVPMHPQLHKALSTLRDRQSTKDLQPDAVVIRSLRGGAMCAKAVVNWFMAIFRAAKLEGCSSHSGRRTFITRAARAAHRAGASLRDVQLLAGHASLETTMRYIDGDTDAQRRLVRAL